MTSEDEEPDSLFIVRKGDVLLSCKGESVAVCGRGEMFGELGLLGLTATGRRLRTAVSLSECELLRMSKESLQNLVLLHGELRVSYRRLALRFLRMLEAEASDPKSPIHDHNKMGLMSGTRNESMEGFDPDSKCDSSHLFRVAYGFHPQSSSRAGKGASSCYQHRSR